MSNTGFAPSPALLSDDGDTSSFPGLSTSAPALAADRATGNFFVAWEHVAGAQFDPGNIRAFDPGNIRARRYDATGTPLDPVDFVVNSTTDNFQAQPAVAAFHGLDAFFVTWTSDGSSSIDLDVFGQIFGLTGFGQLNGGSDLEIANLDDVQDRSSVEILPERNNQDRPQVLVTYHDVALPTGEPRPGEPDFTSALYSVNGLTPPIPPLFVDGFELGDVSAWSSSSP